MSAPEIKRLADRIIAKSKDTYDSVAAVPLDKVCMQLLMSLHFAR
jgi:thimet oligopeptidase